MLSSCNRTGSCLWQAVLHHSSPAAMDLTTWRNLATWWSKTQNATSLSSCEVEYRTAKEAVWNKWFWSQYRQWFCWYVVICCSMMVFGLIGHLKSLSSCNLVQKWIALNVILVICTMVEKIGIGKKSARIQRTSSRQHRQKNRQTATSIKNAKVKL